MNYLINLDGVFEFPTHLKAFSPEEAASRWNGFR